MWYLLPLWRNKHDTKHEKDILRLVQMKSLVSNKRDAITRICFNSRCTKLFIFLHWISLYTEKCNFELLQEGFDSLGVYDSVSCYKLLTPLLAVIVRWDEVMNFYDKWTKLSCVSIATFISFKKCNNTGNSSDTWTGQLGIYHPLTVAHSKRTVIKFTYTLHVL